MNDLDFTTELRARLQAAGDMVAPHALQRRVDERSRARHRRSVAGRAGVVGLAGVAGIAAVAGIGVILTRDDAPIAEAQGTAPTTAHDDPFADLEPSADPRLIDRFPVVVGTPSGVTSFGSEDEHWAGAWWSWDATGLPSHIVSITVFAPGPSRFPDAQPGRVAGVSERPIGGGIVLSKRFDQREVSVLAEAGNADAAYDVMARLQVDPATGRYSLDGPNPAGHEQSSGPRLIEPTMAPTISDMTDESGRVFNVSVGKEPIMHLVTNYMPIRDLGAVEINGLPGYEFDTDDSHVVILATSADESISAGSNTMSRDELHRFVEDKVLLVDRETFHGHYPDGTGSCAAAPANTFEGDLAVPVATIVAASGSPTQVADIPECTIPTAPTVTSPEVPITTP